MVREVREAPVPVGFAWVAVGGLGTPHADLISAKFHSLGAQCRNIRAGDALKIQFDNDQIVIVRAKK